MVFERFPRRARGSLPPEVGTQDDDVIQREAQKLRARARLDNIAAEIGGPGTRVADSNLFQRFLATAGEQYQRANQAAQSFLPSNQEILSGLQEIGRGLLEPPIPEGFVTNAPPVLQPAARVIRESTSPAAAATLPLGGSARVVGGGLLGAAGAATAGRVIGGDTGELIGALSGGVAGGIPAVQRLAGRGIVRAGDEAALRLQGRQVAHAATGQGRLSPQEVEAAFARTRAAQLPQSSGDVSGLPPRGPQAATGAAGTPDEPAARLTVAIQNVNQLAPELRAALQQQRSLELGRRLQAARGTAEDAPASRRAAARRSQMGGQLAPVPTLEPVRGQFSPEDIESLYQRVYASGLKELSADNATDALTKVLLPEGIQLPTPSEMNLLEQVFGPAFRQALEQAGKGGGRKAWENAVEILNISRAIRSAADISAMMRQGGILTIAHPQRAIFSRDSAFGRMIKAFASQDAHDESLARIRNDKDFALIAGPTRPNRLFIADAAETRLVGREEAFFSRLAERIPIFGRVVRGSQRAFNTYLNELKWKTMKHYLGAIRAENIDPEVAGEQGVEKMIRFLNVATGRGYIGPLEQHQVILEAVNIGIWSPRLVASRIQTPIEGVRAGARLFSADPAVRIASRQIAGDLVKYVSGVTGVLTFAKLTGMADVELNSRSSDFGKFRIGPTRIDPWAGFQQIARYTAQLIGASYAKGQRKVPAGVPGGGGFIETSRARVLGGFIRSKLAPGAVSVADTFLPEDTPIAGLTGGGRTFIGERIVPGPAKPLKTRRDRTVGLDRVIYEQFVPLIFEDIQEAIRQQGLIPGTLIGVAPAIGLGVTTFGEEGDVR